jgi:DNA helicase-2/ATP-dependent DNA helicase PcrA
MTWDDHLTPEQRKAASHTGSHARLLAGPGTGKTLVLARRVQYLIQERKVVPADIIALTFTRAAAHELQERVATAIPNSPSPRISTLHSFALRQLLRNSTRLTALPQPLRIADDWEERYIVLEDVKAILKLARIQDARDLFNALSSDWETLAVDQGKLTPDPGFIGAWLEHRATLGYTLRAELVYELKRALEQLPDFQLEAPTKHLLVDEYQDLNRCDLEVIRSLCARGSELYVAGDDDQSIYGFRKAHPEGIRNFPQEYSGATELSLSECKRCDQDILRIGEFVASLDPRRIDKGTHPEGGRPAGEVALLVFSDNYSEAGAVALLCKILIEKEHIPPEEILILLRVDTHGAFSKPLFDALTAANIPISVDLAAHSPIDLESGRLLLAFIRLLVSPDDSLSWLTLFRLRKNQLGDKTLTALYDYARSHGLTLVSAAREVAIDPSLLPQYGTRISAEVATITSLLQAARTHMDAFQAQEVSLKEAFQNIASTISAEGAHETIDHLLNIAARSGAATIQDLLVTLQATSLEIEPEIEVGKVNVLTMHKAKGLTAIAVIIIGVEDEHIPGRQDHEPELGDERRLLFVSLTRARQFLFLTYSLNRLGQQMRLGRSPGSSKRTLSQFLAHTPLKPTSGHKYIQAK